MSAIHSPLAQTGPGGNRLVAGLLLLEHADEYIPINEALVNMALEPMWTPRLNDYGEMNSSFVGLLRSAAYFILNSEQVEAALNSQPPEGITAFPPLPYRRVWIETQKLDSHGRGLPTSYLTYEKAAEVIHGVQVPGETVEVLGVGLVEVVRGREWDVYIPFRTYSDKQRPKIKVTAYRITPSSIVMPRFDWLDLDSALRNLLMMAVNGAHLITARNVPHRDFPLPRSQRKQMQRDFRFAPRIPKLYYVDLAASGEEGPVTGKSREYHCRWLVMGHWRHIPGGDELCTCYDHRHSPRTATFIEPYVKGPVGAPWKGRPVHRAVA